MPNLSIIPWDIFINYILTKLSLNDFKNLSQVFKFPVRIPDINEYKYGLNISYHIYTQCNNESLYSSIIATFNMNECMEYYFYKKYKRSLIKGNPKLHILAWKCAIQFRDMNFINSTTLRIDINKYPKNIKPPLYSSIDHWMMHCIDYRGFQGCKKIPKVFGGLLFVAREDKDIQDILWNKVEWFEYEDNTELVYNVVNKKDLYMRTYKNNELITTRYFEDYLI